MKISYGMDIKDARDPYLVAAEGAMAGFLEAGIPGRFWVDLFPLLKHVPAWMPGAEFKRKAARWRYLNDISLERPFKHVMDKLVSRSDGDNYWLTDLRYRDKERLRTAFRPL
jgi:hypothetical protein